MVYCHGSDLCGCSNKSCCEFLHDFACGNYIILEISNWLLFITMSQLIRKDKSHESTCMMHGTAAGWIRSVVAPFLSVQQMDVSFSVLLHHMIAMILFFFRRNFVPVNYRTSANVITFITSALKSVHFFRKVCWLGTEIQSSLTKRIQTAVRKSVLPMLARVWLTTGW